MTDSPLSTASAPPPEGGSRSDLPSGTVTFLFTDIEGSTRLWEQYPSSMPGALARHDALLRGIIGTHHGHVFKVVGDAVCAAFAEAPDALAAALDAQRALKAEAWDVPRGFQVRMAVHTGAAEPREGDYHGPPLNRTARILAAGHGGQILVSLAGRELARDRLPDGAAVGDLGEFRLKDLTSPERLFQLIAADLPAEFPPLRSLDRRPHNLPVQPTPLVGREVELRALRELLLDEPARLVTLTGPGGTGKTRLSLQAGAELIDEFEDGVIAVFLAAIRDPELFAPTVARALGLRDTGGRPPMEELTEHLRERRMLLILDNFEQVMTAAPLVSGILAAAPGVKVLATSREGLRLRGERELPVPPLAMPDQAAAPGPDEVGLYAAVALFVQRAQAVKPSFRLTAANASAVAEICRRVDGLPLAIELAAARVKHLGPEALVGRLGSRLRILSAGARDLPERQQTLRGAIDWSYELLEEAERALFRRMAIFVGGCTLEAAEAVYAPNAGRVRGEGEPRDQAAPAVGDGGGELDVLEGIASLVNKSLLRRVEDGDVESRFAMLETIREYALEKLEQSGEGAELRRRHGAWFAELSEGAEPELKGPDQAEWLARLERDHDNLRGALRSGLEDGNVELAARIGGSLMAFWWMYGHMTEGRGWLERILERGDDLAPHLRIAVLNAAGGLAYQQGDHARGVARLEEALVLARSTGHEPAISRSLGNLGVVVSERGEHARGMELYEEALEIDRRIGDRRGLAFTLGNFAVMAFYRGDFDRALPLYEESLELHRALGDRHSVAVTLNNLGDLARARGEGARAETLYGEALEVLREIEGRHLQAHILSNLGDTARVRGEGPRARELYGRSLRVATELGQRREIGLALTGLAALETAERRPDRAARLYAFASALREVVAYPLTPDERALFDSNVSLVRERLGGEAFAVAWAAGERMSLEQAVEYALAGAAR